MRARFVILFSVYSLLVVGCTVGPHYNKPTVSLAPSYSEWHFKIATNPPPAAWWKTFNDPELDRLINQAVQTNYDLQIAYSRVRQARFQRNIVAADLFPQVDGDAGYLRARGSKNVALPLGGSGGNGGGSSSRHAVKSVRASKTQSDSQSQASSASGSQASAQNDAAFDNALTPFGKGGLPGTVTELYQVGFDANWEIDVFGSKRRQVEAATADIGAAEENHRQMALTIMAEVARDYFELRGTQERLAIARQNLAAQSNLLVLTESRVRAGLKPDIDAVRARAQVETTDATIPPLLAQIRRLSHALSILVGQDPQVLNDELSQSKLLPPTPPVVAVGLPSDLLERRPDIRAAERNIAAANARIGSAIADLFPKFALTASAGLDSTSPDHLLDWESRYFLISPTVTWRIFDAGRIMSNIKLQQAMTDEASLEYHSTILKALKEVEDALVTYAMDRERQAKLDAACQQNQLALELMQERYAHGLVTFLDVLDAERTALSSQDQLAQFTSASVTDVVALYKALGGGWK